MNGSRENVSSATPRDVPLAAITGSLLLGGSSTFLVNLGTAMARRGITVPVICLSERNEHAREFASARQPVHCVPDTELIYEDRLARGYAETSRYAPRAVLSCLGAGSFELLRVAPSGVAHLGIVQSHDPGPYGLIKQYAPHLDVAIGVSQEIARHLRAMPELRNVRVEYIPYGIDFPPAPARAETHTGPLRIIYVGRVMEEQKRISRVVELIERTRNAKMAAEFTLVGSGPEEGKLRERFANAEHVRVLGALPNDQVRQLLAAQDLFVLLSDYEGLPLSLLEAMGQGVVPLVSDLPSGMRDVVTDDCGFRLPVGDVLAAFEIVAMLSRGRERLALLSANCLRVARGEYSADRMAERYLELSSQLGRRVDWPPRVAVPPPLGLRPWLYRGLMRRVRRALKPFVR